MRPVLVLAIAGLSMTLAGCVETRRGYVEYTPAINEGPVGGGVYLDGAYGDGYGGYSRRDPAAEGYRDRQLAEGSRYRYRSGGRYYNRSVIRSPRYARYDRYDPVYDDGYYR